MSTIEFDERAQHDLRYTPPSEVIMATGATTATIVKLTPAQSAQVRGLVNEGRFSSPEEAVEQLLSQVLDDDAVESYPPAVLEHLDRAYEEVRSGQFVSQQEVEALFDSWRNKSRK